MNEAYINELTGELQEMGLTPRDLDDLVDQEAQFNGIFPDEIEEATYDVMERQIDFLVNLCDLTREDIIKWAKEYVA